MYEQTLPYASDRLLASWRGTPLITNIVASDTAPFLLSVGGSNLVTSLGFAVQASNFFHGLDPAVVTSVLQTDPVLNARLARVETLQPWVWNFGPRIYAVCAWRLRVAG